MMHAGPQTAGMQAGTLPNSHERAERPQPECRDREMGRKASHE